MRVMTWNVHGSVDREGNGNKGNPAKLLPELLKTVKKYKPDVIGLQELCHRQHRTFRAELAKLGYRTATMTYVNPSGGCNDRKGGNKSGNALYFRTSKTAPAWRASAALPYGKNVGTPGIQPRRILGARVKGGLACCVVHLGPGDPDRAEQMARCVSVMKSWADLDAMVLFGDFNMSAASLLEFLPGWQAAGNTIDLVASSQRCVVHTVIPSAASDHPQVLVNVG